MIADNQGRTFLRLLEELQPHFRTDRALPARIQQRLAGEKRFGSRDRRLYRELLYTTLRYLPWIEEQTSPEAVLEVAVRLAADLPATRPLKAALPDPAPLPFRIADKAAALGVHAPLLPDWFRSHCPAAFVSPDLDVLHVRPSLWLRLQTGDPLAVLHEFDARGWRYRSPLLPSSLVLSDGSAGAPPPLPEAVEMLSEADVTQSDAFKNGLVEVQDLGSQLLLESIQPVSGGRWLDACAGAGGKSLQLARLLGPAGHVDATDPRAAALEELKFRARRAGLGNVTVLRTAPAGSSAYDGVLVDAPCSGSGTWRRAPHLKWCTTENDIEAAARTQAAILHRHASCVRSGGLLVYATCSLSHRENTEVVREFLDTHSDYAPARCANPFSLQPDPVGGLVLLPALHNTDGFYVAALQRK